MLAVHQAGQEGARISACGGVLLYLASFAGYFRPFPFWAIFTPDTALIFINNNRETLEVL